MMDSKTKELLRTFAEQLWERDTLTRAGCFEEESDAIDASLALIEQQAAALEAANARIAELEAAAKATGQAVLREERIAQIAHYCETEAHACPGTNMWQCAHMAVEETLRALAEPYLHLQIAEVCEDADGFKHIESVIEDLDDLPKGMKLYTASTAALAQPLEAQADARWQPIETAPKDGTNVLLIATRHSMLMPHPEMIVGAYRNGWWSGPSTLSHVTHWMPLPEAPAGLSQKKSGE